jgi:hypothetical protein
MRLREFEEIKISRQSCIGNCDSKGENSEEFCLDFVQAFGLCSHFLQELQQQL